MWQQEKDNLNKAFLSALLQRFNWLYSLRPKALVSFLLKVVAASDRRRIIDTTQGIRLYLDPFSYLGQRILAQGSYEQEIVGLLHSEIKKGDVVLDIGANEGFFSALAGTIVGQEGLVIAVEPQVRLADLIEINLRLNGVSTFRIYVNAFGGPDGSSGHLHLYSDLNTGASSIVKQYRLADGLQPFTFVSMERILNECHVQHVDFVKVDVEGFEHRVVEQLLAFIGSGAIGKLLIEYHYGILRSQKINSDEIHSSVLQQGMSVKHRPVTAHSGTSHILYHRQ